MLGSAVHVRAEVEHVGVPFHCWQDGADRRAVNTGKGLQHETGNRHQRTRIACRNRCGCLAGFHQINSNAHGRVLFIAHGNCRRLIHSDNFGRMVNTDPGTEAGQRVAKQRRQHIFAPNQDRVNGRMAAQK